MLCKWKIFNHTENICELKIVKKTIETQKLTQNSINTKHNFIESIT